MDSPSRHEQNGTSYIARLNLLAQKMEWPLLGDELCRFSEERLYGALDLWLDVAAGSLPYRRDLSARLMRFYIPQLTIFERVPDDSGCRRYRVRLMGTDTVHFSHEMSGRFLDEAIRPAFLPRWYAVLDAVLDHLGPVRILSRCDSFDKKFVVGESLSAPLLDNAGRASLIMSVSFFDGMVPWSRVAAAAWLQLGSECLPQNVH